MRLTKKEKKLYDEFMKDLEPDTYTRDEIVKKGMGRAIKFFINENGIKEPLKRLIRKVTKELNENE